MQRPNDARYADEHVSSPETDNATSYTVRAESTSESGKVTAIGSVRHENWQYRSEVRFSIQAHLLQAAPRLEHSLVCVAARGWTQCLMGP